MKRRGRLRSLIVTWLLASPLVLAGAASGQPAPQAPCPPPPHRDFIADFDADGDGRVAANEFRGPADRFADLDADGDGFIDRSEAPQGPPPPRDLIGDLDQNGDGVVSAQELDGWFAELDRNSDGVIDRDEAPHGPPPPGGEGRPRRTPPPSRH